MEVAEVACPKWQAEALAEPRGIGGGGATLMGKCFEVIYINSMIYNAAPNALAVLCTFAGPAGPAAAGPQESKLTQALLMCFCRSCRAGSSRPVGKLANVSFF